MRKKLWKQWQADWRWMEAIAQKRGWDLTPLAIAPPASEAALGLIETKHGLRFPPQLRELLSRHSAHVAFGWHIPSHLHPMERQDLPTSSANRAAIWDLAHIDQHAIPNFFNDKRYLADRDISEAPNRPEMWENQFPFYWLINGDYLTIDVSKPDGPHPVRYFSQNLEMLHGLALAPDFFAFVTEMSRLGFAGTEWASWMRFSKGIVGDTFYLSAATEGGKAWRAWLERDPKESEPDVPPPVIVETTPADRALLKAAHANSLAGVTAALAAGAKVDVVWNSDALQEQPLWGDEFCTAVTYATRHNNIAMLDALVKRGATLDTRHLPLDDAAEKSSLETVKWLIAHGARVNGWKDQRHWPLHFLVTRRDEAASFSKDEFEKRLREEEASYQMAREVLAVQREYNEDRIARHIDRPTYNAMLEALLQAGAKPDAPWDNGITMLMHGSVDTARILLKHGANIAARNVHGSTALHWARTSDKVRFLVERGADINARATPPEPDGLAYTPLQSALLMGRLSRGPLAATFLELGANPKIRDGAGRSTLCYCRTIEHFRRIQSYGLDPHEKLPDGGTLLHNLLRMTGGVRVTFPEEVAFLDFLLGLGLDINARDERGQTMLHLAAERAESTSPADYQVLLDRGADKSIKDKDGQRAFDLVPKSQKEARALLA